MQIEDQRLELKKQEREFIKAASAEDLHTDDFININTFDNDKYI